MATMLGKSRLTRSQMPIGVILSFPGMSVIRLMNHATHLALPLASDGIFPHQADDYAVGNNR